MKRFLRNASFLCLAVVVRAADTTTFWVEPCTVMKGACDAGDADLARWALEAWEKASGGRLHFVETKDRTKALLRVRWADKDSALYGEAVSISVNGRPGAELHILIAEPPGTTGRSGVG